MLTAVIILSAAWSAPQWTIAHDRPWPAPNVLPPAKFVTSLDGPWHFAIDPSSKLSPNALNTAPDVRTITVPSCWEAAFDDLIDYDGIAWYWRDFDVPASLLAPGRRIFIRFDAADYLAKVWLNGTLLGSHEGGYSPFEFEVTTLLRRRGNRLIVRIVDPSTDPRKSDGIVLSEVPNGKQSHYCNIGGLWQSVHLVSRASTFIHSIFIAPQSRHRLAVRVCIDGPTAGSTILLEAIDPRGRKVARSQAPAAQVTDLSLRITNPMLWSPSSPSLYMLRASLLRSGVVVARAQTRFGVRTIEARDQKLLLNGSTIFLAGALDQAFYPRGIYAPVSGQVLETQAKIAKSAGLNFFRTHIKIPTPGYRGFGFDVPKNAATPTPGYLDVADEQGIVIWSDFPSWYRWNDRVRRRVERQMYEWVWRDFNRPSIFCWCLINEEWGMNFDDPAVRRWIKSMWHRVKSWDPYRLVVDNSPAGHGHVISDIFDQHVYMAIPERADDWIHWLDRFCSRPKSSFRYPDSEHRGFEPLLISEFGNWGLPDVTKIRAFYGGRDPYWFNQSSYGGPIRAGLDVFESWRLRAAYGSLTGLAEATQRHQLDSLKYEIEQMRLRPQIVGYVITQLTDLNSESNGLMDMCRHPKLAALKLAPVQAQTAIVPNLRRRAFFAGQSIKIPLYVSHFGPAPTERSKLVVTCLVNGRTFARLPLPDDHHVTAEITLPSPDRPRALPVTFQLHAGRQLIATNTLTLWVIPHSAVRVQVARTVSARSERLQQVLARCGAEVSAGAPVRVSEKLTEDDIKFVASGGRLLLLASAPSAFGPLVSRLQIVPRHEKGRIGNWATAFCFLRPTEHFALRLPYDGHLGMPFIDSIPMHVIDGLTPDHMADAWGGLFVAWMHDPAATALPIRLGDGLLTVVTFRLADPAAHDDPVAQVLLSDFLDATARLDPSSLSSPPLDYKILSQTLIPTAREAKVTWRYTTQTPPPGWQRPSFDDSAWQRGPAGFGRPGTPGAVVRTQWTSPDIYLRKTVRLTTPVSAAAISVHHDEDAELYINGVPVASWHGYLVDYRTIPFPRHLLGLLHPGDNVIAVHCHQTVGGRYIDMGIKYAPAPNPACPLPGGSIVVRAATEGGDVWAFTTTKPPSAWTTISFDDSSWPCGLSPFGHPVVPNVSIATDWHAPDIWLRKTITLPAAPSAGLLRIYHDEDAEVYVNGRLIFRVTGFLTAHKDVPLPTSALVAFRPGPNVLAVHCHQTTGGQLIDLGLYLK